MTRTFWTLGLGLVLVGCPSEDEESGDTGTPNECTNILDADNLVPAQNATDLYYRDPIIAALEEADSTASISLAVAADGTDVPGTNTVADEVITFVPSAPLTPSTEYTVTVNFECGPVSYNVTTSNVGNPLTTDVVGRVYELNLAAGRWVEPPGIGAAIASLTGDVEILISPTQADTEVAFLGALGTGNDEQDVCVETFELAGASFTDPFFELSSPLLPFTVGDVQVDIEDLLLNGSFAPDGSSLAGIVLEGTIDTRPLVPLLDQTEENAVCVLAQQVANVDCVECSDNSGQFCLSVRVESINAPEVPGASLQARDADAIEADPNCPS